MDFKPPLGAWVKTRRIELDVTRGALARRIGYAAETLRKIESGALKPSRQMAGLLAKHLHVPEPERDAFVAFALGTQTGKQPATGNLPTPATPLIGRKSETTTIVKLLRRGDVRLVTLIGPPGVGKTRLAVEVAREACSDYADGAWWIELAPISDPNTALTTIAQVLGVEERPGKSPLHALQDYLRDKHALLALDNLEQMLEVGPLIGQMLSAAPKVNVLAASREALRIAAEHRYAVSPLAADPAVALFAQRAKAVRHEFALDEQTGQAVAYICRRLDGLPLAIELAAAQIALFTPAEMLARLNQHLPLLAVGARDLPARQRTLEATLDWSYHLLTLDEQALFRRLGVFAGGCTLDAAEMVCDVDGLEVEAGLEALTMKSLITGRESANGQSRYTMLETMRAYALDQLRTEGEYDAWHEHLADYLVALQTTVNPNEGELLAERDNWRAAVEWVIAAGRINDLAPALLHSPHDYHVSWREQIVWLESVLAHPHIERHSIAHARVLSLLGETKAMQGELKQAAQHLEQSAAMYKVLDLQTERIEMLFSLGITQRAMGDLNRARAALQECMQRCHELGLDERIPHLLITQAEVEVLAEDGALAKRLVDEAFALGGQDVLFLHAWGLNHQAHALLLLDDHAGARALAQRSLDLFNQYMTGCTLEHAWSYSALAEIALSEADALAAARHALAGVEVSAVISEQWSLSWCLAELSGVAALERNAERGAKLWGAGEALREHVGCHIAPASRLNRERTVTLLREQLGEAEFERLAAEGKKMTLDEAVAFALVSR
jgi:predicted ATPase/DNA-binding XRE family transcriptional regulator